MVSDLITLIVLAMQERLEHAFLDRLCEAPARLSFLRAELCAALHGRAVVVGAWVTLDESGSRRRAPVVDALKCILVQNGKRGLCLRQTVQNLNYQHLPTC